ncbi:serine-rich adhesin for platelets-like [Parasteatoda tepidariorum]|uniref:serine-rich adhesin for platelets-like n=1 Tax=Parasteatoda tepidariorum TaxID=114398 RepID=UPI00077FB8EC|nr:uncharacterized protein LOC107443690 [Parasteatoda tepidariorum]
MANAKERNGEKDSSAETSSGSKGTAATGTVRPNWNVMAVRGKVTDKCLWSACKAMTVGFLCIIIGAVMATLGFYTDHLSKVEETKGNTTVWVKNEAKDSNLGFLTYLGPVVMGIGGFTIVAACVMTFEARDTAAKIVPIWFKRTRIHVVSGGSGSTPSGRSSKASWERFLSQQRSSEDTADTRTAVTQALVNFSKYLQNSVDTNKIALNQATTKNSQNIGLRKCPSEPSLAKLQRDPHGNNFPEAITLLEASTPQPSQRTTYGGGLKTITGASKPQLLSVAPDTYRQAVSMDCPRSSRIHGENDENESVESATKSNLQPSDINRLQTLTFQTSCATSSSGSMSVDIYLPQGAVTLKVHDEMKNQKRSPLKPEYSDDSRCTKFSQHSDMHSFGDDELFLSTDLDDSVFTNQELSSTPQIVLDSLESKGNDQSNQSYSDNHSISSKDKTTVEMWASKCHTSFSNTENKSESMEVQTPGTCSVYSNFSTNFSFDCSEKDSPGLSIESVISNPFSSRITSQFSPTQTDMSLVNISSLNSMGSSQDINSPLVFCGSPSTSDAFDYSQETIAKEKKAQESMSAMKSHGGMKYENTKRKVHSVSESVRKHVSITLEPDQVEKGPKSSPRKHSSLESAQIQTRSQTRASGSPKRHQHSLESCNVKIPEDTLFASTQRFLSPKPSSPTLPSPAAFSPRKTRSESLPERRAPSIKRFPLLRQGALDSFAEEGGSTHRLDRSQTQISPKDP